MEAGSWLFRRLLTLRISLVIEHVRVSALLPEILCESVARPHRLQTRIFLEARLRNHRARIDLARRTRLRLAAAEPCALLVHRASIGIVLHREVLSPDRGIFRFFGEF